ncbi:MAG: glycosyltransferase [Chitinophagaceae bacterium]|nr:MAG: glycosyltransferase [Chitinophagaceae bacterium]
MAEGDVFVFPSHYESFGLVCCEAMAAGRAVVGSRSGGMAEIIEDGKSGILVEPKNPAAIAKAVTQLLENNELRLSLGKAAQQRITDLLSPSLVLQKQIAVYQKAIDVCRQTCQLSEQVTSAG